MAIAQAERAYETRSSLRSRVKRNERRITELEVELQALRTAIATPPDYEAPFNTARECADGACSYHNLYLATGPATMSHAVYHRLETAAARHFEACNAPLTRPCVSCQDFATRCRA